MKYLSSEFVIAAAMIGASMSAFGAAGTLGPAIVVTPLQPNVTYSDSSSGLKTYAGFTVAGFTNQGPNTINDVTITFTARATDSAEAFSLYRPDYYLGNLPIGCTYPSVATPTVTITCKIKQLKSGLGFPEFTVFYNMPSKVNNGIADGPPPLPATPLPGDYDYISTEYKIVYAEGLNDCDPGLCQNSISTYSFPNQVLLGTANATIVRSGVPQNGGKFFTGLGVFPTTQDPWMSVVEVPPLGAAGYATATIDESPASPGATCINCNANLTTLLQIPSDPDQDRQIFEGTPGPPDSGYLKINLLRDVSLNSGLNIKFAKVYYLADGASEYVELYSCGVGYPTLALPVPCILSREQFKNNDPIVGRRGDWWFVILAVQNGRTQM